MRRNVTKRRPVILVVGPTPPPYNGMSVVTQNLLKSRLCDQFEIVLLDIADRRGLSNVGRFDWRNVGLAVCHGFRFLSLLVTKRPDIVYVCISQNTLGYLRDSLFLVPARLWGTRVVVHLHGGAFRSFYDRASLPMRWLIDWTLRSVRRMIVLGDKLRPILHGLVDETRIAAVPNGIAADEMPDEPLKEWRSPSSRVSEDGDRFQITYLGSLIETKGFLDVLRAAPLIAAQCPGARFVLAGGLRHAQKAQEAQTIIEEQDISGIISMPGVVVGREKAALLRHSHVFVFPPCEPEGQPLVILEAMAAGLPVITTDQGAITETVLDGVNGFIVPARDPEALAEKVVLLLNDPALRERMAQASRERFLEHYTLDRWANDMVRVFQGVLEKD